MHFSNGSSLQSSLSVDEVKGFIYYIFAVLFATLIKTHFTYIFWVQKLLGLILALKLNNTMKHEWTRKSALKFTFISQGIYIPTTPDCSICEELAEQSVSDDSIYIPGAPEVRKGHSRLGN